MINSLWVAKTGMQAQQTQLDVFAKMVEWGMRAMQAIGAATMNGAEALGMTADVGAIAVGRYADIIAVDGDPLADLRVLEKVKFVMVRGRVIE